MSGKEYLVQDTFSPYINYSLANSHVLSMIKLMQFNNFGHTYYTGNCLD